MLPHLDKILGDDLDRKLVINTQGCGDCSHSLTCQTTGTPRTSIYNSVKPLQQLKTALDLFDFDNYLDDKGIFSPFVVACFRPLALLQKNHVPVERRHEYLWFSPCVPLRIKLSMAFEFGVLAYRTLATAPEMNVPETDVRVGGFMNPKRHDKHALDMLFEAKRAFEAGCIPAREHPKDENVWNAFREGIIKKTEPFVSLRSCLAALVRGCCFNDLFEPAQPIRGTRLASGLEYRNCQLNSYERFINECHWASNEMTVLGYEDALVLRGRQVSRLAEIDTTYSAFFKEEHTRELQKQIEHGIELLKGDAYAASLGQNT